MRHGDRFDDESVAVRRKDGNGRKNIIIFLPWNLPIRIAERLNLIPPDHMAAYQMPNGIISSIPEKCVESIQHIEADFTQLLSTKSGDDCTLVGLSIGNFPATYLANKYGLRLLSVASGARGDWLIFNSRAATHIRDRALKRGHSIDSFAPVLKGWNPIENLSQLGPRSKFVLGMFDSFVPRESQRALIEQLRSDSPQTDVWQLPLGHRATIWAWRWMPLLQ